MTTDYTIDHFWVAAPPFCSSTILVAPDRSLVSSPSLGCVETKCTLFDVDGAFVNSFEIEFPAQEAGIIELEPFMAGLKMQSGIAQGHLAISSPRGCRHFCRQQTNDHFDLLSAPRLISGRDSSFIPIILGGQREHLIAMVNASEEPAHIVVRLFYGNRSPEWSLTVAARGCGAVALEDELLTGFDDVSWKKGAVQGYIRISMKGSAKIALHVIERIPVESQGRDQFRCLPAW